MPPVTRRERVERLLRVLLETCPDAVDAAVVAPDGRVLASLAGNRGSNFERISAIVATLTAIGRRNSRDMGNGEFLYSVMRGSEGYTVMTIVPGHADTTLMVTALPQAGLGGVLAETRATAAALEAIL